jgi:hypothetical protein
MPETLPNVSHPNVVNLCTISGIMIRINDRLDHFLMVWHTRSG